MTASERFARVVGAATRRPLAVLAVVGALAIGGGVAALGLEPSAEIDTLVGRSSDSFKATELYHERFGDDAILVLVRGQLDRLVLTADVQRLLGLEGCISGNVPSGVVPRGGPGGPCAQLARARSVKVVYGPGTFLNESVRQIDDQYQTTQREAAAQADRADRAARVLARSKGRSPAEQRRLGREARKLVETQFLRDAVQLAVRYGVRPPFQLNNPNFVSSIVFDPRRGPQAPKARFAYLFPNKRSALIQVRLAPGLDQAKRERAIELVRAATEMPDWRLPNSKGTYVVTGAPVVVSDLSKSLSSSILVLLLGALVVMAATLALVFKARPRLLPLVIALAATGLTFGGMALAGVSITMASIAVLPVLIGLAVDYAIQFHARFEEQRRAGGDPRAAAVAAAGAGGPTIATAGLATAVGFLVLLLSPVPMVRGFGLLLVIGIGLAFACALTAGFAALTLAARGNQSPAALRRAGHALSSAWRGAGELLAATPVAPPALRLADRARDGAARVGRGALREAIARPARVLGVALALAAAGWALDTQTEVVSELQQLVPQDLRAVRDIQALQQSTGVAGEIDVTVRAADLAEPRVVNWMRDYQAGLLKRYGYTATRGCGRAQLCPALSLPDLFQSAAASKTKEQITALLDAVPPYFSQAVITRDRRVATLAFGIKLMPLDRQQDVIDEMRRRLDPPAGVTAQLAGLPVLGAQANSRLSSGWRRALTLVAGLLAVFLVLLAVYRRLERALVPLVPIALATGWSALVLFAMRIPLNPMSASLGALVIAISTEFGVLLSARYRQERIGGLDPAAALEQTYLSTGAAVLASGVTAIAGFAVLALSDIRMLRDFGFVTVVDLTVSLLGVLVVLPAVLILDERGELLTLPRRALARGLRALPRPRRWRTA